MCEFLCRSVVEAPDEVEIDVSDTRDGFRLDVHVGQGDMGRVIGKRGRVANAIRTVVGAAAAKDGVEVEVEFID
ncbi:MAG: KH domain-containing protein [Actinomycetia bacterium]|nr:KH domain-containing protein [Actinomycetes bacterium]